MAKKLYEESNISAIAGAIRSKNGSQETYTTADMANAIADIETEPDLETLSVVQNGNYTPSSGKDGFSQVSVNVPGTQPVLVTKSITENGTYIALDDDSADGYSEVTVNVQDGTPPVDSIGLFNLSSWTYKGRVICNKHSGSSMWLPNNIRTDKAFRMGIAFEMTESWNGFAFYWSGNPNRYSEIPGIETNGGGVGFGVPGGASSWKYWKVLGSNEYSLNEWIYAEFSYDPDIQKIVLKVTNDFENWITETINDTLVTTASNAVYIGGWANHTAGQPNIDLYNTFIEQEGTIIWGHYTGSFPE